MFSLMLILISLSKPFKIISLISAWCDIKTLLRQQDCQATHDNRVQNN